MAENVKTKKKSKLIPKHKHSKKECRSVCDAVTDAALAAVSGNAATRAAFTLGIKAVQRGCHKCCNGKGFYENCVRPIKNYIQQSHDHMFPDEDDDYINNDGRYSSTENWADRYRREQERYWNDIYNGRNNHNSIFGY